VEAEKLYDELIVKVFAKNPLRQTTNLVLRQVGGYTCQRERGRERGYDMMTTPTNTSKKALLSSD